MEIHGRSLFLQGMMFAQPNKLPKKFNEVKASLKKIKKMGVTPLQAALDYLAQMEELDVMVLGVHNVKQFSEIILEYRRTNLEIDWRGFSIDDARVIDPSLW